MSSRDSLIERLSTAAIRVMKARNIVTQQEEIIERLRRHGLDTTLAEEALTLFKYTLQLFEEEYKRLKREFNGAMKD